MNSLPHRRSSKALAAVFVVARAALAALCTAPSTALATQKQHPPLTTAPAQSNRACLECHSTVQGRISHAALISPGCNSCHQVQTNGRSTTIGLVAEGVTLCTPCHKADSPTMQTAHQHQPLSSCVSCHDPHSSNRKGLMLPVVHEPFAERDCASCHEPPKDGKVVLRNDGFSELCLQCHNETKELLTSAHYVHGILLEMDTCTTCHDPHASRNANELLRPLVEQCSGCHTRRAQERATKEFLHDPVFRTDGCVICHEPHAADERSRLRAPINDLCMTCHASDARGDAGSNEKTLLLFGETVRLPGDYLRSIKKIDLRAGERKGHPTATHPVAEEVDPSEPTRPMTCISCHDPHAGQGSPRRFVTGTKSMSPLCVRCHG